MCRFLPVISEEGFDLRFFVLHQMLKLHMQLLHGIYYTFQVAIEMEMCQIVLIQHVTMSAQTSRFNYIDARNVSETLWSKDLRVVAIVRFPSTRE